MVKVNGTAAGLVLLESRLVPWVRHTTA